MSYLISIVILFVVGGVSFFIWRILKKVRLGRALNLRLISIRLPQKLKPEEQPKDFKDELNLSAQLYGILSGLKSPFALEAAVHHIGEEIHFYAAVPKESVEAVSRQIEGLWKDAQVEPAPDFNIFNPAGASTGIFIQQKLSYALPLRTYVEANVDTFAPILSGLSKINEIGEGMAIQILARPAPSSAKKSISQMISNLKKGKKIDEVLKGAAIGFKDVQKAISPTETKKKEKEEKVIDEEAIKTLESKIMKPLLAVNLRVIALAPVKYQAEALLESASSSFSQFSAPLRGIENHKTEECSKADLPVFFPGI